MTTFTIHSLYRYPVKGFTPEPLDRVALAEGARLPWDRAFAVENGSKDFDPVEPAHFPKTKFLQLMQFERLATLSTRFDPESGLLRIEKGDKALVQGNITTPTGRHLVEQFLGAYFESELRGPPRLVHAPGHAFTDIPESYVSLINRASVRELERVQGAPVNPLRFRANIYIDGGEPWSERGWIGRRLRIGQAEMQIERGIVRCAATNVDPAQAKRDMQIPRTLAEVFGRNEMGVYGRVVKAGTVAVGDAVEAIG